MIMHSGGLTVLSRYLQSSQGSCHDICKYGTHDSPRTESRILRNPMLKIVVQKQGAGRNLEKISGSNLVDRKKKTGIIVTVSPDFKAREPDDHIVIKIAQTQGHHGENVEEDLTDTKNSKVGIRPSNDAELKKPEYPAISLEPSREDRIDINAMAVEGEAKDEETDGTKSPEGEKSQQVSVKPSPDSEATNLLILIALKVEVSNRGRIFGYFGFTVIAAVVGTIDVVADAIAAVAGEMTISKGIRTSAVDNKKSAVTPSVSLSPKEFGTGSDNLNGVSHLLDLENVKKLNSEQAKPANVPETTSYQIESHPENKPAKSDRHNVVSIRPSSSSRDKTVKQNSNKIRISRPPHAHEKKKMIYTPKVIQASGVSPSLSSFQGRKNLRPTPNGLEITQPSLTSLSSSASLESFHNDISIDHDKAVAEKKKGSSKMMYKVKPKRALMITSNNKHLHGNKLNFQKREPIDSRNDDNRKGKVEDCSKGTQAKSHGNNINSRVEEFRPKRLKFRQRVAAENRDGDNQNSKFEEFTPTRLNFRRKVNADNRNDDNQNSKTEELSTRTLQFRQNSIVDDMNADNQNSRVDEFTTTRLELNQRAIDERNADDENGKGEVSTPTELIFKQTEVDGKKNNSGGIEADVVVITLKSNPIKFL
ncbi:hypothetical protein F3Y22_tig00117034pilonHSYRG01280 [Hibiscus syriacus]|uniref:Uncharacterized protein n=1 Tax=Hibiscus syriacus TaxID=106335 RepID=A0A6A2WN26_HIBSY|nr:hypothetical protein F3Y22_tig00117034pilonHSYRG01280 [Hibiscus syriacus]